MNCVLGISNFQLPRRKELHVIYGLALYTASNYPRLAMTCAVSTVLYLLYEWAGSMYKVGLFFYTTSH